MKEARYAQTQGVTLLEQIVSAVGPIFTVAQAQAHAKSPRLTPVQVRWSLGRLA